MWLASAPFEHQRAASRVPSLPGDIRSRCVASGRGWLHGPASAPLASSDRGLGRIRAAAGSRMGATREHVLAADFARSVCLGGRRGRRERRPEKVHTEDV